MVQARRVPPVRGMVAVHHSARRCAVSEITALCFDDRKRKIVLGEANGTVKVCIAQDAARNSHGECSSHPGTIELHRQSATCSGIATFGLLQDAPGAQHATVTMVRHATLLAAGVQLPERSRDEGRREAQERGLVAVLRRALQVRLQHDVPRCRAVPRVAPWYVVKWRATSQPWAR